MAGTMSVIGVVALTVVVLSLAANLWILSEIKRLGHEVQSEIDRVKARQVEIGPIHYASGGHIQSPALPDDSIPAWLDNGAHSLDGGRTWIES
ncbi:hypothetical protein [Nocardia puris]|uniref:hypothetical protein n=1 Tax=Nocardia puris TaxID=208602 RepID=UPI002E248CC8